MSRPPLLRPRRILIATVLLAVLAAAGVYARTLVFGVDVAPEADASARPSGGAAASSDLAVPVELARVVRDTLVLSVRAAGEADAWQRAAVVAEVGGRVAAVRVRESAAVRAGEVLVVLDTADAALAVREAEAARRDAEAKYRELTLQDEAIADAAVRAERARIARARSGLDAAEVRLRRAELDLERTRIRAPFAGRVASLRAVVGQWVRPGEELLGVLALDPLKVEVQVLEGEVGFLAPGQRARVSFAAEPGAVVPGVVESINPLVEGATRTARVTLRVQNPGDRILPGMYARVALEARRFPDRVLVPRAALLERDRRTMLFVYEDGRAKWRYVTPGLSGDSLVEILSGVETDSVRPGEQVLIEGHTTLVHDAKVRGQVSEARGQGGTR